jgi:murein DD-endopeptidase MepM/ murein hydrolase activator NlpD
MHEYQRVVFGLAAKMTNGYSSSHKARDYVPRSDDTKNVYAVASGTVTDVLRGQRPGADDSNMVIVRNVDGNLTIYGHCDPSVNTGTTVSMGDKVGVCDLSGVSTGHHVHLVRMPSGDNSVRGVLDRQDDGVNYTCKGEV